MPTDIATADQPQETNINTALQSLATAREEAVADTTSPPSATGEATEVQEAEPETVPEGEAAEDVESEQSIADWLQDLTQRESTAYAQRYPTAWKALTDPNTAEDVKHLLRDKINSDRELARRAAEPETQDEPTVEAQEEAAPAPPDPQAVRTQHYQNVDRVMSSIDQSIVKSFGMDLISALTGTDLSKADSKNPEVQALMAAAPKVGAVLAKYAIDLNLTTVPQLAQERFQDWTESAFPGSRESYEQQRNAQIWQNVVTHKEKDGTKPFENLPVRGSDEFYSAAEKALGDQGWTLDEFQVMLLNDPKTGKPFPPEQQTEKKYKMLAKAMKGQKVNPVVLADAFENGKKEQKKAGQKSLAGKTLGAGKSIQNATGSSDNELRNGIQEYMSKQSSFRKE